MRAERQVVGVVRAEHEQDLARHVERDQSEQRATLLVAPGGRRTFAVQERVVAFPYEVVLVADLHERALADTAEEGVVDHGVVGARPTGDVLQRIPVGGAFRRIRGQPYGGVWDVLGVFVAPGAGGFPRGSRLSFGRRSPASRFPRP